MSRTHLFLLMAILSFGLLVAGCGEDDDDDDGGDDDTDDDDSESSCDWSAHDPLIARGKEHLGRSEIYLGYEAFAEAWRLCPDSVDARTGLALACQLEMERAVYEAILWYLTNPVTPTDEEKSTGSILQALLQNHFLPKVEELLVHAQAIRQAPETWSFYIDSYPFIVEGELVDRVIVDMGGEWDHADGIMMEAGAEFYRGMIHLICAYDLTTDKEWIDLLPELSGDLMEVIHAMTGWVLMILNDPEYPQFLTLKPGSGTMDLALAGLSFGSMYALIHEGASLMLTETDDQADDVSGYHDANHNGKWDTGEPYRLPYIGVLSNDQNITWLEIVELSLATGYSTWDGSGLDVHPGSPDLVWLDEYNFLLEAVGFPGILPPIPFSFGPFYYDQYGTELKESLRVLLQYLYEYTEPEL